MSTPLPHRPTPQQAQHYQGLPFVLDRATKIITLPSVNIDHFNVATAITMTEASKLMRGRTRTRLGADGRERVQVRHVAIEVVRRWCCRGWHVELDDPMGTLPTAKYTLKLPSVKLSGELLTMREWVESFEVARWRLSTRNNRKPAV